MWFVENEEVIDFFNMTAYRFLALKMFKLKCYLIFKNWLHVTADDVTVMLWQTIYIV